MPRVSSSARRRLSRIACQAGALSWAQLIRMQSIPATSISRTNPASVAASDGIVTMIRVGRRRGIAPSSAAVLAASTSRLRLMPIGSGRDRDSTGRPAIADSASSTAVDARLDVPLAAAERGQPERGQPVLKVTQVAPAQRQVLQQVTSARVTISITPLDPRTPAIRGLTQLLADRRQPLDQRRQLMTPLRAPVR